MVESGTRFCVRRMQVSQISRNPGTIVGMEDTEFPRLFPALPFFIHKERYNLNMHRQSQCIIQIIVSISYARQSHWVLHYEIFHDYEIVRRSNSTV